MSWIDRGALLGLGLGASSCIWEPDVAELWAACDRGPVDVCPADCVPVIADLEDPDPATCDVTQRHFSCAPQWERLVAPGEPGPSDAGQCGMALDDRHLWCFRGLPELRWFERHGDAFCTTTDCLDLDLECPELP